MRSPTNTAAQPPMSNLLAALPGGIEAQERAGQGQFINSDVMPTNGVEGLRQIPGVKILSPVPDDPIFTYVELPAGWKKQRTDHSMWSDLIDDKGRMRAAIFYDRSAHMRLRCRFTVNLDYDHPTASKESVGVVKDAGVVIHRTNAHQKIAGLSWKAGDLACQEAKEWLEKQRPDHANPHAYWNE